MRRANRASRVILICTALLAATASQSVGQSTGGSFSITSQLVAGGGCGPNGSGGCTPGIGSGNLSLDGTVGQATAADLSSQSPFSLRGGFWYGPLVATPTAANGTVSGTIVDSKSNPVAGAVIQLSGTQNRTTITDANGSYHFENVETNGFYTVTPGLANYSFSPSSRSFSLLGDRTDATFTGTANSSATENPLNTGDFFVRQHYLDFLNREPDRSGLAFWINEISSCGTNQQCIEVKHINVSAAFYLSIEFQQTGYLVERIYKTAYGDASGTSTFKGTHQLPVPILRLNEFLHDTQEIRQSVIVGQTDWEQVLENNKQRFTSEFVRRTQFTTTFPTTMTPSQLVDALNTNAGHPLSQSERDQLINDLSTNVKTRGQVLRTIAEHQNLVNAESNRAFVLMQFFGYLRRNPNDPQDSDYTGYDFWLSKLNQFNGNFVDAEMVKAFISSGEYRNRFGP